HGALWLNWKTTGPVQRRSSAWAGRLGAALVVLFAALTGATLWAQPLVCQALETRPWLSALAGLALAGLGFSHWALVRGRELAAFLGSALFLTCFLGCAAAGLYPVLLPAVGAGQSLTVANSASADYALRTGLDWWLPGLALAVSYFVFLYRGLPRKFDGH
ncbi:MAG TPA: cytochrome d ubiquinol oxidase subunit II, partial [bacterium]|nr:cytochrome d ubiquinol oxidase subunit II [bacterium]